MKATTKIKNLTGVKRHFAWIPKHGLTLEAGEELILAGAIGAKNKRAQKIMDADLTEGAVAIIVTYDTAVAEAEVPASKAPAALIVKESTKVGKLDVDIIQVPATEDDEDGTITFAQEVDIDADEVEVYGLDEKLIPKQDTVELTNIADIDDVDVLANMAKDIKVVGEEESAEKATADKSVPVDVIIPSKTAMKKMNKDKVTELATSLSIVIEEDETKAVIIDKILKTK